MISVGAMGHNGRSAVPLVIFHEGTLAEISAGAQRHAGLGSQLQVVENDSENGHSTLIPEIIRPQELQVPEEQGAPSVIREIKRSNSEVKWLDD